jgi:putative FmdB family regulatory protein
MPTYEYECPKCGVFDVFQNMTDERLKTCPTCRSRRIKRLLGRGAGIIFKGSGFYQTDYRSSGYSSAASADRSAKSAKPVEAPSTAATPSSQAAPASAVTPSQAPAKDGKKKA